MAELVKLECCSVCLDNFIKPKIIDCNHVFCEACLEDVVQKSVEDNKFPCPLCRVSINIPSDGTSDFPEYIGNNEDGASRYLTSSEEEEVKPADDEESEDDQLKCVVCTNGVNAEFECIECDKLMCNACKTSHDLFFKLHHVDSLKDSNKENKTFCLEHEGEDLIYFCTDCNEPVCGICLYQKHSDHTTPDIEKHRRIAKSDLNRILDDFNNYVGNMNMTLFNARQKIDGFGRMVDDKIQIIEQMCDELKSDCKILCTREEAKMTNDRHLLNRLETAARCISKAIDDDSCMDVLDVLPNMKSQYEEMEEYVPNFDITKLDDIFTKQLSTVAHTRLIKYTFEPNSYGPNQILYYSPKFIVSGFHWQIILSKNNREVLLLCFATKDSRQVSVTAEDTTVDTSGFIAKDTEGVTTGVLPVDTSGFITKDTEGVTTGVTAEVTIKLKEVNAKCSSGNQYNPLYVMKTFKPTLGLKSEIKSGIKYDTTSALVTVEVMISLII